MNTDRPLAGCSIVITRPLDQAQPLAELVREAGGNPILFPLLEIAPLEDYQAFDKIVAELDRFDWAVFISSNAVQHSMTRLLAQRGFPSSLRCAAIGPATAAELVRLGISRILIPTGRFDSESLLDLPEMQAVAGKRFLIFRGEQGRELLAEKLRERGAIVEMAESYRRINPQRDTGELSRLWQNKQLQAIVVTSSEALRNLIALAGRGAEWLKCTPLFVNHPRIAETATGQGLHAIVAQAPGDAGMLDALVERKQEMLPK